MLSKENSIIQQKIIDFLKPNIKNNNFNYKLLFFKKHITDDEINMINSEKDIVLWNPKLAHDNLEIVKYFANSIAILDKPSLYIQKISDFNPINENLAINNGFNILYINPSTSDITNDEWKLVVQPEMYLTSLEKLIELIKEDEDNFKKEIAEVEDIFETITNDIIKQQINLS